MTKKEMTEIFSVMMLAWPGHKMFEKATLQATIELWTACLADVDFWLAQQAAYRLCRECKFPPSIADFKEKSDSAKHDVKAEIDNAFYQLKMINDLYGEDHLYEKLEGRLRAVVDAMGGVQSLTIASEYKGKTEYRWNYEGFERTYESMIRGQSALPQMQQKQIRGK